MKGKKYANMQQQWMMNMNSYLQHEESVCVTLTQVEMPLLEKVNPCLMFSSTGELMDLIMS